MRKRKFIVTVIMCVVAVGISVALYFNRSQDVQTAAAVSHQFTTFIEGAGNVEAPVQVVVAPSGGKINEVFAREGQFVRAGDALLQMDDKVLQLQLEEAILALNAQKKAYQKRNGELTQGEKTAAIMAAQTTGYDLDVFAAAQNPSQSTIGIEQVDLARLKVQQVKEMIGNATVTAAIDGVVLEVNARCGELLAAGRQAALVAAMDDIEIDSVFTDADTATILPGMAVQLYGGCLGTETCSGQVIGIKPKAETQQTQSGASSMATIRIKPDNPSLFKRLGASVELKVITGKKTGVGVPLEALAQDDSGLYVYVIRNHRSYRINVEIGVLDEFYAEVLSGIAEGDTVALNPTELRNRMKVSP